MRAELPHQLSPNILILIRAGTGVRAGVRGWGRVRTRLRVGVGIRVRVGFKDSVGVQNGQKLPSGAFGAREALGAFGAHGLLRPAPLATNCWPEAPWRRGRGGRGVKSASQDRQSRSAWK